MGMRAALLGLALFASLGFASGCDVVPAEPALQGLMVTAALMMVLLAGLAYMGGETFRIPQAEFWAKNQVVFLATSFVVFIIATQILQGANALSQGLFGTCPIEETKGYLSGLISDGEGEVRRLIATSISNQILATDFTYHMSGPLLMGGKGWADHAEYNAYSASQEMAINLLLPSITSIKVQYVFIELMQKYAMTLLLPLGLLVRFFPGMHRAGEFMVALAIGLYMVFPLTYALSSSILRNNPSAFTNVAPSEHVNFDLMGRLLPQAIFFPNLATVLTVSFTMTLSRALGSMFTTAEGMT